MQYTNYLSLEDRINFLSVMAFIMAVDGNIDDAEMEYIELAAMAHGVPNENLKEVIKPRSLDVVVELAKSITDNKARRYLIRELISLSYADGELVEDEKNAIFSIGYELGLSNQKMEDMVNWVLDGIEWQIDGESLIEED